MLRDPSVWDRPDVYDPDRFLVPLKPNQPDPSVIGFGFGRRLVPPFNAH
jgi:cytochrome P450